MQKRCIDCGEFKEAQVDFPSAGWRNGKRRWRSRCHLCMRERYNAYSQTHRVERAAASKAYHVANKEDDAVYAKQYRKDNPEYFSEYDRNYRRDNPEIIKRLSAAKYDRCYARVNTLKDKPCVDCGHTFPPECLDFDHRDSTQKSFTISKLNKISFANLLQEIAKCDLICSNCHRTRTLQRKGGRKLTYRSTQLAHEIDQLKAKPCTDCGESFPPECMDFDHIKPKKRSIGALRNATIAQRSILLREIAKCELVCSNCHRIRTKSRKSRRNP